MKHARHVAAALVVLAIGVGAALTFDGVLRRPSAPSVGYTLLDGTKANTEQLRGKVVLVNFWATSCTICLHEMPQIVAMHEKFKARGYETLAVAMSYDPPANVIRYAETKKLPFSVVIDISGQMAQRFGSVQATPVSVLINKRGQIVKRFFGEPDFAALHQLVDQLLAET